jgi:hypothetical protein
MASLRERREIAVLGLVFFLAAAVTFAIQVFWFLREAVWYHLSLMDVARMLVAPEKAPWAFEPQSWLGLHAILEWMPLSLALIGMGLLAFIGAIAD